MVPLAIGVKAAASGVAWLASGAGNDRGGSSDGGAGRDFASVLSDVMSSASQSVVAAERISADAIHGRTSAREVVEAVMQAEQNLQIAVTLRDKCVSALQEISRMAI